MKANLSKNASVSARTSGGARSIGVDDFDYKRVDVLDGIRAVSVILVLIFHFWQQTWIFPQFKTPWLEWLGVKEFNFTPFARVGYLFVDMMVLISGFLLFLPVARNIFHGAPMQKTGEFFRRRAIRILPSYLFCVIVLFIYETTRGGYGDPIKWNTALSDLFLHLTFLQTLTVNSYLSTKLNVVLWTVAIEVWFYILFPVFAWIIKRHKKEKSPLLPLVRAGVIAVLLIGLSHIYIYSYVLSSGSDFSNAVDKFLLSIRIGDKASPFIAVNVRSSYLSLVINQLPAFFGVYGVGLTGAVLYTQACSFFRQIKKKWALLILKLLSTALSLLFIWLIIRMVKDCASVSVMKNGAELAQRWQITERLKLALVFMGFILSAAFAVKPYKFLFSNKLMVFLSTISYNLYIWHQWLSVKLKNDWRIPYWEGEKPPNYFYSQEAKIWKNKYAAVITVAAFVAAILATYLIERPAADLLNGRPSVYNGKLKTIFKREPKVKKTPAINKRAKR